jgi:antirestriction protein ArdC
VQKQKGGKDESYPCLTSFIVYNVAEVEGIAFDFNSPEGTTIADSTPLSEAASRIGVAVHFGHDSASYSRTFDRIKMPNPSDFVSREAFFAVFAHELVHSTGHNSRLARTFGSTFGDADYAKEELVAELGATMLCAKYGVDSNIEGHASYLEGWLSALKSDKRFIFKASSCASKAIALLVGEEVVSDPVADPLTPLEV